MVAMRTLKRVQARDPMFLRKVFVSHYVGIPFHHLDRTAKEKLETQGVYPEELIKELYAASFHLVRNFELAPFASDTSLEDQVASIIEREDNKK